jgi:uncharacterized integral membrane protein (TIGR00697 family)
MTINEKVYISLCVLFSSLIIVGNLTYQKFVILNIPYLHQFELSVGAVLYPVTFLITDLISEFYGKERANFCVRLALFMNIIIAIIIAFMDYLPATSWSKINDSTFHQTFGFYSLAFIGSVIACYIAQSIDIYLYLKIKKFTKGKYLWLRNNGSTCISLFVDTTFVVGFLTLFKILPTEQMGTLILNSYLWKVFFTLSSTPLFYILVHFVIFLLHKNQEHSQ